jgi:hypothetical protein
MRDWVDYIKDTFSYDPLAGTLVNKVTGKQVGFLWSNGNLAYMKVSVREGNQIHQYQACRVAYLLMTGKPLYSSVVVSYKNGDPADIRWDNLVFTDRASVSSNYLRPEKPKYEPTNDPHVFRGVHNGVYVVRRWNPGEGSTLAVLRFDNFEQASFVAQEWRASLEVPTP